MEKKIIYQLVRAGHKLKKYMEAKTKEKNIKISAGQSGVLFLLQHNDGLKMSELGRLLKVDNSAITRVVDRLVKNGLVQRTTNPDDRRQYLICLTEKGKKDIAEVGEITNQTNEKIKEGFTTEEIKIFLKVLNAFENKF